ncbi:hypothetical protein OU415_35085, partial [Saccharopolyspora sp. WRP15-2]|nr:hypothetical protein [Saccharopolyspora oryzae]
MTAQDDLITRPITGTDELDLFCRIPYTLNEELADDLASGRRRPEWMWVALRGDRLLARAAWWSRPGDDAPVVLDVVDVDAAESDRVDIGVQLLRTAMTAALPTGSRPPGYSRFVEPDWRGTPAGKQVVDDRMAVLERLGAELFVERVRFEWRPG